MICKLNRHSVNMLLAADTWSAARSLVAIHAIFLTNG
jgi:hypothetical protein